MPAHEEEPRRRGDRFRRRRLLVMLALVLAAVPMTRRVQAEAKSPGPRLELLPGDRIAIIGNTLAERMQHAGWLETFLHARFPGHELVIRNLGYSGDEIATRLRSDGFGSPDDHLSLQKADVILAFFGFNESFAGQAGLGKFEEDLGRFLEDTLAKKYNGESAPRVVLFSPLGHEDLRDPNLPDGRENNERIALYADAMKRVAAYHGVPFVDLFRPALEIYARSADPLTINGIHLNDHGDRLIAETIEKALFPGGPARTGDEAALARLRAAVLDKNFHWFHRYRVVDGYSVYGGRAGLKFVDGQTNREVMQRELEVLDVMTANRDRRVWALARGGDLAVDDSNTPPFIPVKTNKPGSGPDGKHLFLGGEEALGKMTVHEGMKVNLFASEEEFPELANPVQMTFDARGRLWVAVMPSYPHWKPRDRMDDKVLILEDADGDGKAETCKAFAGGLHVPTGLEFWGGGLFVGQQPALMFLADTDGDDRADLRERVLHGLDSADTHHALNSFVLDPGGALYFQEGTFHHTQVETPWGGPERCANAGVFRYEPRTRRFDVYISYGFANPHGHVFDRWGQDFVTDGTGNVNYFAAAFSGRVLFPRKHGGMKPFFEQRTRPTPGTEILSSRHFPEDLEGNYLVANVIGFQGILRYRIEEDGSGFKGTEVEPIVSSTDPSFRPSDMEVGPDGALYFLDWQNPVIGHMQHNLRDPSRDTTHGRVYRVTWPGRPLLAPARIAGEPIDRLLDLLKEPEDRVRYRARIELSARPTDGVIAAVHRWLESLDPSDPDHEHRVLEGLWVHQHHNRVDRTLLERVLSSRDHRARAAATRVLCYWRDRVPGVIERLQALAADPHPRVRLEAVRAASFLEEPEAIAVPLTAAEHAGDYYLDYARSETMKTLEPYWKQSLAQGGRIPVTGESGRRFLLREVKMEDLLRMERDRAVCREILLRTGVRDEDRREALRALARVDNEGELRVLLAAVRKLDAGEEGRDDTVLLDLVRLLAGRDAGELAGARADLESLATAAARPATRQVGFVALVTADGSPDRAWDLAARSPASLADLMNAMPLIPDPGLRSSLYPRADRLLDEVARAGGTADSRRPRARYVRIELPRRGTLTLAEVEVWSEGKNVARGGKASQKNTAHDGEAGRAIDGNASGAYGDGGQTHTREDGREPWWEVDLGAEHPLERIAIHNRTDGDLGKRLDGFTLLALAGARREVFRREKVAAPAARADFDVGAAVPEAALLHAAMIALTYVRGEEARTFRRLLPFVRDDACRGAAVRALARIPRAHWPAEEARPLVAALLAHVARVPAADRTSAEVQEAMQLAEDAAVLLPAEEAARARKELGALGVRVIRLGALPHQMLYDRDRLAAAAGKPVEILFENTDLMPHNLVVTRPGALEEVGTRAEEEASRPDALGRHYVPRSDKVLFASRLLQPAESQRLAFTAPAEPGIYPYVCTYPGHWRRMFGALYVVEDLEAFLADEEGYLARRPLPIADEILKVRGPRTAWKFEDLAGSLAEIDSGRSYANAREMFRVASCIACHRVDGAGNEFGPDLTRLAPERGRSEILRDLVEPSTRIEEKFSVHTFVLASGEVVSGLVLEETGEAIKVIQNPLVKAEPVFLKTAEVAERSRSPVSLMPEGLLSRLTREEILDLVAFMEARCDRGHKVFQGGCGHEAGGPGPLSR